MSRELGAASYRWWFKDRNLKRRLAKGAAIYFWNMVALAMTIEHAQWSLPGRFPAISWFIAEIPCALDWENALVVSSVQRTLGGPQLEPAKEIGQPRGGKMKRKLLGDDLWGTHHLNSFVSLTVQSKYHCKYQMYEFSWGNNSLLLWFRLLA